MSFNGMYQDVYNSLIHNSLRLDTMQNLLTVRQIMKSSHFFLTEKNECCAHLHFVQKQTKLIYRDKRYHVSRGQRYLGWPESFSGNCV